LAAGLRSPALASNIGANRNYNRAIELARGTYFKLGSDDDLLEPGYIEEMTAVLDADPAISIAHSAIRYIDDDGAPLIYDAARGRYVDRSGHTSIEPPDVNCATDGDPVARFHAVLRGSTTSHFGLGLLRMSVLRRSAGFGLYYSADRAFVAEMALYGSFADTPEVLFHKREHRQNSRSLTPEQKRRWAGQLADSRRAEYLHLLRVVGRSPLSPWDKLRCLAIGAGRAVVQRARAGLARR